MNALNIPYIVIKTTQPPYSTSSSVDALEAAMAASNIGIKVIFVFADDGVYQLNETQEAAIIEHKSIYKRLKALPLFDIDDVYVQATAVIARNINLEACEIDYKLHGDESLCNVYSSAQQVLVF